ncbi:HK97 family phage prohead protease [Enterococcus innesii]|jgi:HK97 family phage prohead protease|uniref:HK97 family phage prohead protease n=1 Tax=Enterococcus innesii TaxID=2839759 RepID=UPI003DA444DF
MNVESRIVSGYAIKWNDVSNELYSKSRKEYFREMFRPKSLIDSVRKHDQALLYAHDKNKVITWKGSDGFNLLCDDTGLYYSVELPSSPLGNTVLEELKRGYIKNVSIGFKNAKSEFLEVDGVKYRIVTEAELREISFVHKPAYINTSAVIINDKRKILLDKINFALD